MTVEEAVPAAPAPVAAPIPQEPARPSYVLAISTAVEPSPVFTVDGAEYKILTFNHLSAEAEADVTAMLARYDRMTTALEVTGSDSEARSLAHKLREKRIDIICALSTLPRSLATTLPLSAQATLLQAIQSELSIGSD